MSRVTSSAYPVVTVSQSGDQFTIVQGGQFKKLTRQGLADYIATLAPNTFIALTDAPGSYVGQQGKVPVVNATEDGLEFQAATSGNFLALADTPVSYGGNATRLAVVNGAETGLEFIDNAFIDLMDTPAAYAGASEYIVRVNTGASAVEFVTPTVAAPAGNLTGGWFDIDNAAATQNYTATGTFVTLVNDAAGTGNRSDFAPAGITDVYDEVANAFDFSQLSVGDEVMLRIDIVVETTSANQTVDVNLDFDNGGSPFDLAVGRNQFKTAGINKRLTPEVRFYLGSDDVKNNPVEAKIRSDADLNIDLRGYAVFITRLGAL